MGNHMLCVSCQVQVRKKLCYVRRSVALCRPQPELLDHTPHAGEFRACHTCLRQVQLYPHCQNQGESFG